MLRNNEHGFGWVSITLHWVTAIAVLVLFPLGLYMTDLTYFDPLYNTLPFIHRSIGVLLFMVVSVRLVWRIASPRPRPLPTHAAWERLLASLTHGALYALLFAVMVTGYLMSTADGRAVSVFGWFQVPATITSIPGQEDVAGDLHYILAITLVSLVGLHVAGALKHHFIDRDTTLWRIVRPGAKTSSSDP
jgi:cytochrome b561